VAEVEDCTGSPTNRNPRDVVSKTINVQLRRHPAPSRLGSATNSASSACNSGLFRAMKSRRDKARESTVTGAADSSLLPARERTGCPALRRAAGAPERPSRYMSQPAIRELEGCHPPRSVASVSALSSGDGGRDHFRAGVRDRDRVERPSLAELGSRRTGETCEQDENRQQKGPEIRVALRCHGCLPQKKARAAPPGWLALGTQPSRTAIRRFEQLFPRFGWLVGNDAQRPRVAPVTLQ